MLPVAFQKGLLILTTITFANSFTSLPPRQPLSSSSTIRIMASSSTSALKPPPATADLSVDEIYALVDAKGKHAPPVPTTTVAAMILLGVPTFLAVLPISIFYQISKSIVGKLTTKTTDHLTPIDSGIVVSPNDIIPFQDRKYDLVIMGATGFTGSLCVRHLAKTYGVDNKNGIKWAMAGRSQSKLDEIKKRWAQELGNDDILTVDTIVVDTNDPSTLPGLVKNTRAVSSTAGPFEKYGSPVVEYCAKYGTNYADITGEVNWSKHMTLAWEETAQRTGAKIVSLCGSDSIPWDLSTMAMEDALPKGETLTKVTYIDELVSQASGGTIATVLLNLLGHSRGEPEGVFDQFLRLPDGSKSPLKFTFSPSLLPKKFTEPPYVAGMYGAFFVMAPCNAEVVKKGVAQRQRATGLKYYEYGRHPDWKSAVAASFGLPLGVVMMLNPITKFFLNKFIPNPGDGPSMEDMENNYFGCTVGYGEGSKGTKVETVMYFPQDQGYLHTARMLVESGLCLAADNHQERKGGFFASSTGMGNALLQRLRETGTYFGVKTTKSPSSSLD